MGSHQMSERQVLDAVVAEAIRVVFNEYVEEHGLAEISEILSRGVKVEVGDMLRAHSIYCLPSIGEPFGMTILEAMACGVPIVATRAGGIPDLVPADGGRLVPTRDPAALAAALVEILGSTRLQCVMGAENRARVEQVFDIEKAVDRLEAAYEATLSRVSRVRREFASQEEAVC